MEFNNLFCYEIVDSYVKNEIKKSKTHVFDLKLLYRLKINAQIGLDFSRRFDIEFKQYCFYQYNEQEDKYEEVKVEIPLIFIQESVIADFETDFSAKNADYLTDGVELTYTTATENAIKHAYYDILPEFDQMTTEITQQNIIDYCNA